jgi:hypothetical protein
MIPRIPATPARRRRSHLGTAQRRTADLIPASTGEGERRDTEACGLLAVLMHAARRRVGSFMNADAFIATMGKLMVRRLRLAPIAMWNGDRATSHEWPASDQGCIRARRRGSAYS